MKKDIATVILFGCFSDLTSFEPDVVEVEDVPEVKDASNPILETIYAPDPITHLPSSDIGCFLSSDTRPEIRQWIQDNLLVPRPVASAPSVGVDDDVIAELTRGSDETSMDYARRISAYSEKYVNEFKVNRSLLESSNVSASSSQSVEPNPE